MCLFCGDLRSVGCVEAEAAAGGGCGASRGAGEARSAAAEAGTRRAGADRVEHVVYLYKEHYITCRTFKVKSVLKEMFKNCVINAIYLNIK